ncbi:MAG TPA: Tol-Pal system beta propeller repeat protein TolB [Alphaproteobacteria bacterium]|nr:Tol-Pal system beta propeller repeat protein TolB [Alphaproteobacteria bacterium]
MKKFLLIAIVLASSLSPLASREAKAELKVDITRGVTEPIPMAITTFIGSDGGSNNVGQQISSVVTADLERSGLFRQLNPASFIQPPQDIAASGPKLPDWKTIGAQGLVAGTVTPVDGGRYRVEFRLWDTLVGNQMAGLAFTTTGDNWRRIAHKIADVIYNRITGETGYFDTRIVYISESGPVTKRVKRLAIMDQDGANHKFLTDGSDLVLTPRFNPAAQEITFMSFRNKRPRVYLYNLETGQQRMMGEFPGMTFAPRFTPDGRSVIFSLIRGGNSDIFVMDLASRKVVQLTNHPSINTGGSHSPDGRQIAFESDRSGKQQIYVMSSGGGEAKRISFGDGRYGTPVWSPRGDLIAFTKMLGGQFYIGVMRPDGSGERLISQAYHIEGPTWAPNGRVLMYFKKTGAGYKMYSIDLTGFNERQVATPLDASDPAWSPLLP